MNRKKALLIATIALFTFVLILVVLWFTRWREKDYSFQIKAIEMGEKSFYIHYKVGDDVDGETSCITDLVLSTGDQSIRLNDGGTMRTDDEAVYIWRGSFQDNFPDKKEAEIVDLLKNFLGKDIDVSATFYFGEQESHTVPYKLSYKINDFLKEKTQVINTPFEVDGSVTEIKSMTFDKYCITLNLEQGTGETSDLVFDIKDQKNNRLQALGGNTRQQIFWNEKGLETIFIAAYTIKHPLSENTIRVKVPVEDYSGVF